ncbi:hypothetical protein [Puniceibacterium antarcticum]|nr:hypothetical protein [Puniceibacterium antarcticum]
MDNNGTSAVSSGNPTYHQGYAAAAELSFSQLMFDSFFHALG